jgi:hypothetical protein
MIIYKESGDRISLIASTLRARLGLQNRYVSSQVLRDEKGCGDLKYEEHDPKKRRQHQPREYGATAATLSPRVLKALQRRFRRVLD